MTDKNNESALLLRMNKEEQVSVLQEIGFTSVNENTPASDIANISDGLAGCLTCPLPQSGSKTVSTCSLLLKNGIPLVQITVQNTCV